MIYYIIGFFLFLVGILEILNIDRKYRKLLNVLSLFLLILFASLRWKTGTDWISYYEYFVSNQSYDDYKNNHHNFEFLFMLIAFLVRKLTSNYNIFLFIYLFLGMIVFYLTLKRTNLKYFGVAVFSYYMGSYMDFFGGMRSAVAILLTLYSIEYLKNKNIIFFLINIIATQFHRTAIIFLGSVFIIKINLKKYYYIIFCILFYILGKEEVILEVLKVFYSLFKEKQIFLITKLGYYLSNNSLIISDKYLLKDILSALKRIIILAIFLFYKDKIYIKVKEYDILFKLYFISICIYFICSSPSLEIFKRMSIYYFTSEVLLLPILLENIKNIYNKIIIYLIFTIIYFGKLTQLLNSEYGELFQPYYDVIFNLGNRVMW